jgi:hypothetical protein
MQKAELMGEEGLTGDGDERFWDPLGDRPEACRQSARKDRDRKFGMNLWQCYGSSSIWMSLNHASAFAPPWICTAMWPSSLAISGSVSV